MAQHDDEEKLLRSVALQNAKSIHRARQHAENELVRAKEALEQKTQELALSLAMMRATLESTTDGILVTDGSGKVTDFNENFVQMWRMSREIMDSRDHRQILKATSRHFDGPRQFLARIDEIYASSPPDSFDLLELADGRVFERSTRIQFVEEQNVGRVWSFREITERRHAEEALRSQSEWLRVTLASIGDGVITTDTQARVRYLNEVAESLTGWTHQEAAGQPLDGVFRIINEQTRQPVENPATRALREGVIVGLANHTILITKNGTERPIDDSAAPIRGEEGNIAGCVLIFRDVSQQRQAVRALEQSEARKTAMFESALDCILNIDHEGTIVEFNAAAERTFGYGREDMVGRDLVAAIFPRAFRERHQNGLAHYLATGEEQFLNQRLELSAVRADGSEFPVEFTVTRIPVDGPPLFTAFLRDITERKRTEAALGQLADNLSEADRRKNEFLAMLAHELRNPLAPILNVVQMLRLTGGSGEAVALASEMMDRQVRQMVRLVDDLLDVSRISRGKIELRRERVELAMIAHQAVEAARSSYTNLNQELTVTLPPQPIFLNADPTRLAQVVGNLLNNACKFTDKGGRISVTVETEGTGPDAEVVIRVRDNGIGIAADQLSRIFEMFTQIETSVERSRSGLGIGLALVKTLVELHGGTVEVHSAGIGRGSEFVVRLPILVETSISPPHDPAVNEPTNTTTRRILVVDDNRDSAESLAMLLELAGNETHIVHDGIAAVEAATTFQPDVVMLDIGLPKLNGYQVARKIREQPCGKGMVLVALTGWGQDEDQEKSRKAGFNAHLVKPVDLAVLTKLLGEMGASAPAGGNAG